ncbi:sigma-70 family RNA polymerase sigma factor [Alkalihalobacillus sp. AL-G]|uniref:sigma-70 family RNA polymerase sigma factor n=1 Tax=Alkalihalobacillus sp. AL-G TaxID=2926399 RepID=UPI00272A84E9|nr:sigma-70 family RNA polymerase sigma factor [Alkalihalobacillus sp. AL-G]WLD94601.1 sigma-70 family RNA polymerase sigma factor [Alkalihalobacillus sp. AL-G]
MRKKTLDKIYEEYARDVYRYLFSLSRDHGRAEDIMQETFYRAYLHIEKLNDEKIKPWLFRVAHNAFIDQKRKSQRETIKERGYFEQEMSDMTSVEEHIIQKEQVQSVFQSVDLLPTQQKEALILTTIHQFNYLEAAGILNVSVSYLRILIFRARKTLRQRERTGADE